jgi:hypothetical protein
MFSNIDLSIVIVWYALATNVMAYDRLTSYPMTKLCIISKLCVLELQTSSKYVQSRWNRKFANGITKNAGIN